MAFKKKSKVEEAPEVKPVHERGEFDVVSQEEVDEIMKNYDPESNVRVWKGWQEYVVKGILAVFSIYTIYVTLFATMQDLVRMPTFVGLGVLMGYLVYPAKKGRQKVNHIPWFDWIIMILGTFAYFYIAFTIKSLLVKGINLEWYEYVIGAIGVLSLAELCRRSVGVPILCVAGFFVGYAIYFFSQKQGFVGALKTMIFRLFYTSTGIFTTPILERTGISDFFIQMANSLAGSASGGPAKVAVISSALCGMVSGSSVGNTVTTGSVTIPMMKKTGYRPEFAGAVEAAASTGGQIMPPVMGAAAFLMIDYVGVPYSSIIVRAILPAVLYFLGIFIAVHLEAKRTGLLGIPKDQLPVFKQLIKKVYLLLPLVVLVVMVSTNLRTMAFSAAMAILFAVVVANMESNRIVGIIGCVALLAYIFLPSFASLPAIVLTILVVLGLLATAGGTLFKGAKMNPGVFIEAMANGGKSCISIIAACGIAGCVAGCIAMTGLLLHRAGHGRAHHGQLLHHGLHLRPHPHQDGRAHHRGPLLRVLLRHRGGHHPAGGPGGLRGLGHRQVRSHEDGRQRDEARHRGVHRALRVRHGSHHDVRGRGALVPGGADLPDLRHRHLRRGVGPGGLHVHGYALVHADRGHRGRLAAAGPVHLDGHRGPRHRGGGHRLPVPAVQEKESRGGIKRRQKELGNQLFFCRLYSAAPS